MSNKPTDTENTPVLHEYTCAVTGKQLFTPSISYALQRHKKDTDIVTHK